MTAAGSCGEEEGRNCWLQNGQEIAKTMLTAYLNIAAGVGLILLNILLVTETFNFNCSYTYFLFDYLLRMMYC